MTVAERFHATLPSGATMPLLGFGTWELTGDTGLEATRTALDAGYRHLDTATKYGNEQQVGEALSGTGEPVFVTTKLPPDQAGRARKTLQESLAKLGVDAVDLWLIHWTPRDSVGLWRAFVDAQQDGLVRDVGVSNYSLAQLDELTQATGVTPAVNQIRWSPLLFDAELLVGHRERGVVLEGYSTLKGGTLTDPMVTETAERLGRTPAQVLVRWHLQHGVAVLPRSSNPERIAANAEVDFVLTDDDMAALDALGT